MDANGVIRRVYDQAENRLRITAVAGPATSESDDFDANGVLSRAFDGIDSLRVVRV